MLKHPAWLLICIVIASCHQDSDVILKEEDTPDPPSVTLVTRMVTLLDTTADAISSGHLNWAGQVMPLAQHPFTISGPAQTDQDYSTLSLTTADGYSFHAVPSLVPNDINYHHWTIPPVEIRTHQSTDASEWIISEHVTLILPPNSLMTPDSVPYHGPYTVRIADVFSAGVTDEAIPSFTGIVPGQAPASLSFNSCILLHIASQTGEALLTNGQVRLVFSQAPMGDTWWFDPEGGIWRPAETPKDDHSIAVSTNTYYGHAASSPLIRLKGHLRINGMPIPHASLRVSYDQQVRTVYTTNTGEWVMSCPSKTNLRIETEMPGGEIFTSTIETSEEPEMTVALSFSSPSWIPVRITGTIRDCTGDPLTESILLSNYQPNRFLFLEEEGLDLSLLAPASDSISVQSFDPQLDEQGPSIVWPVQPEMTVGSSFACSGATGEYILLQVDQVYKMYWGLASGITPEDRLKIERDNTMDGLRFDLYVKGQTSGVYDDTQLNILFEDMTLGGRGYSLYCPSSTTGCGFTAFRITHFPSQAGPWIRGTFSGQFWIKTFSPLTAGYRPVYGEFQVNREF